MLKYPKAVLGTTYQSKFPPKTSPNSETEFVVQPTVSALTVEEINGFPA
jgi:hypothetical protein